MKSPSSEYKPPCCHSDWAPVLIFILVPTLLAVAALVIPQVYSIGKSYKRIAAALEAIAWRVPPQDSSSATLPWQDPDKLSCEHESYKMNGEIYPERCR